MKILGIHDGHAAAAALLIDGRVIAAVQEERFNREKNWSGFPLLSIQWVLEFAKLAYSDIDAVAVNGMHMPYPKDRDAILREYRSTGSLLTGLRRMAKKTVLNWFYVRQRRNQRLKQIVDLGISPQRVHFVEHHAAHASAAYYGWGRYDEPVLVLTNDGSGDRLCASVSVGQNGSLQRIAEVSEDASIGDIYAVVTFMMGMVPLEHEYKLMGMAPYSPDKGAQSVLAELRPLMRFKPDNGMVWERQNGCPETFYSYNFLRKRLEIKRFDWICAGLQRWTEEMLAQWVGNCVRATDIHNIALSGGVFMNVKANKTISELSEVKHLFVFPSCGDETNAIGAAYWIESHGGVDGRHIPALTDVYWGPSYENSQIEETLIRRQSKGLWKFTRIPDMNAHLAELLARGEVIARCSGRAEFGARALGNRSILADPTRQDVVRVINEMIKSRDFWMPFAPAILDERASDYLANPKQILAPYMIMSFDTTERVDELRAAIHPYDLSARPQIVYKDWNPEFFGILKEFERLTGRGAILNTSFNLHGYPIVNDPNDALDVLENSGLKYLVLGDWLVTKG